MPTQDRTPGATQRLPTGLQPFLLVSKKAVFYIHTRENKYKTESLQLGGFKRLSRCQCEPGVRVASAPGWGPGDTFSVWEGVTARELAPQDLREEDWAPQCPEVTSLGKGDKNLPPANLFSLQSRERMGYDSSKEKLRGV